MRKCFPLNLEEKLWKVLGEEKNGENKKQVVKDILIHYIKRKVETLHKTLFIRSVENRQIWYLQALVCHLHPWNRNNDNGFTQGVTTWTQIIIIMIIIKQRIIRYILDPLTTKKSPDFTKRNYTVIIIKGVSKDYTYLFQRKIAIWKRLPSWKIGRKSRKRNTAIWLDLSLLGSFHSFLLVGYKLMVIKRTTGCLLPQ